MLKIFHKKTLYEEHQSLSISADILQTLSITNDQEMIAIGGKDMVVRILKRVDGQYVVDQSL